MASQATFEIFIHLDMIGRGGWHGDPDGRPLTEVGQQQARWLAEHLGATKVDAVYASPNLRCRQSIEPLAQRFGLPVQDAPGFQDLLDTRSGSAEAAPAPFPSFSRGGSVFADLQRIKSALPEQGRAVICSN